MEDDEQSERPAEPITDKNNCETAIVCDRKRILRDRA